MAFAVEDSSLNRRLRDLQANGPGVEHFFAQKANAGAGEIHTDTIVSPLLRFYFDRKNGRNSLFATPF